MSYEYVGNDKKFKLWNQMKIIQIKNGAVYQRRNC